MPIRTNDNASLQTIAQILAQRNQIEQQKLACLQRIEQVLRNKR